MWQSGISQIYFIEKYRSHWEIGCSSIDQNVHLLDMNQSVNRVERYFIR